MTENTNALVGRPGHFLNHEEAADVMGSAYHRTNLMNSGLLKHGRRVDVEEAFKSALRISGIEPATAIIADGKLHRFHILGDRRGSKNGWYFISADQPAFGQYGCFKRGISRAWTCKADGSLTAEDQHRRTARSINLRREIDEQKAKMQAGCRAWCLTKWLTCQPVKGLHPYLSRKGVDSYGLRIAGDSLMVPLYDLDMVMHGLQFIRPDGRKKFKAGTAKEGHFFPIGSLDEDTLLICEGYATGATLHAATGKTVVVAFDAGNLRPVAVAIRQKYPTRNIIVCADNDQRSSSNTGVINATAAALAVEGMLAIPEFETAKLENATDFNDLQVLQGLEAVRQQLERAARPVESDASGTKALTVALRRMSDVKAKPIRWLWPGRFARGKVSVLAGHPGLGKTQVTLYLAAAVTTGGTWPVDQSICERGNVVILSAEDDAEDTIRPRLEAAGADLKRIFMLDAVIDDTGPRSFNLARDVERLGDVIAEIGDVALVIIDPITAYLGGIDSHKNADIRALLSPLGELASRHSTTVLCVSHLNKGSGEAMLRVTGSMAFVAAARAAFVVTRDPDDNQRRLFIPMKNNIANDQTGLAFSIEPFGLPNGIQTSRVKWEDTPVMITADEAMAMHSQEERTALSEAKDFLMTLLKDGPVLSTQIERDAGAAGHTLPTVRRAKLALGIKAGKDGMRGGWSWQLPSKMIKES